jgi:hypothetical protein
MKISFVTNNMGINDKTKFRHHILSLMLGLPVVRVSPAKARFTAGPWSVHVLRHEFWPTATICNVLGLPKLALSVSNAEEANLALFAAA